VTEKSDSHPFPAAFSRGRSFGGKVKRLAATHPAALVGAAGLLLVTLLALLAPILPLPNHLEGRMREQFLPPSPEIRCASLPIETGPCATIRKALFGDREIWNLLGTDSKGRDLLSRIAWGSRVSLLVGLIAAMVSLVIGVLYGAISGYLGGHVDDAMMRFVDVLYSVPFIFVVICLISILQEYSEELRAVGITRETVLYVLIGTIYWLTMSRVVRGQILSLKEREFVRAAEAIGASRTRIIIRHLLPNVFGIVLVYLTLTIPRIMLFEAFLSFLGLGVEPPDVSWGLLASDAASVISPVSVSWWLAVFPGAALATTLLCLNLLGDGLRDILDPKIGRERNR
jgi:oligopeptide transport system permease protein